MSQSMKDKIEGGLHQAKGAVKEKVGKVAGSPDLKAEGSAEKHAGKAQKKLGDVEKALGA